MSFATTPTTAINPWMQILAALEKKINRQSFETWLKPTRFSHIVGRTLYVRIPTQEFQHIGDKYSDLVQEAIDLLKLELDDVSFVTVEADPSQPPMRKDGGFGPLPTHAPSAPQTNHNNHAGQAGYAGQQARRAAQSSYPSHNSHASQPAHAMEQQTRFDWSSAAQLNPRYTFDNFVIGSGNQFARAASLAVAERPSKAYNPLFLYGGVGMGKTHLMHAIGHEVKRRQPIVNICYVSAEKFTNEMINSLRNDRMTSFRDRFRTVDVLLIDDIQFIAQKERTQEEFFHTFNALHESMK